MVQCFDPASISPAVEHCLICPFLFTTTHLKTMQQTFLKLRSL